MTRLSQADVSPSEPVRAHLVWALPPRDAVGGRGSNTAAWVWGRAPSCAGRFLGEKGAVLPQRPSQVARMLAKVDVLMI